METECVFCGILHARSEEIHETDHFIVLTELAPVSPGHKLVVSKRCTKNHTGFSSEEQVDFWNAVALAYELIKMAFCPDGFNVGFNDGPAAGQTQMHFHAHVIPRYKGDVEDPTGGIRNLFDEKIPPLRS